MDGELWTNETEFDEMDEEAWSNFSAAINESFSFSEMSTVHLYYYYLWTYVAPALLGSITVIGTIGNSLVIYVICSGKVRTTITNILLLNLAITDIAFLLICVPFKAHKYAATSWDLGVAVCKATQYLAYVSSYVTVWSLVSISAIRFVTVVLSAKIFTKRNVAIVICLIWGVSLLANIPAITTHVLKSIGVYTYCGMKPGSTETVFVTYFLFAYALPLLIICILYILIMIHLQRATNKAQSVKSQMQGRTAKACKVIITVVLMFAISWLPYHVNILVGVYGKLPAGAYYEAFRVLWDCMAYSNSCVNPIIYNYVSNDFKKAFKQCVSCWRNRDSTQPEQQRLAQQTQMTKMSVQMHVCRTALPVFMLSSHKLNADDVDDDQTPLND